MEWFWAAMTALWTWAAAAMALWCWRAPKRWDAAGFIDNGLGTVIRKIDKPTYFRGLLFMMRFFSLWALLFALFGFGATLTWIWRAAT